MNASEELGRSRSLGMFDESLSRVLGVTMEVTKECKEYHPKEHAKSSLPKRTGYDKVHEEAQLATSKFRQSQLLTSWLNDIYVSDQGVSLDIVSLRRLSDIDSVCRGCKGDKDEFFYAYVVEAAQEEGRANVPNLTQAIMETLQPESAMKRLACNIPFEMSRVRSFFFKT